MLEVSLRHLLRYIITVGCRNPAAHSRWKYRGQSSDLLASTFPNLEPLDSTGVYLEIKISKISFPITKISVDNLRSPLHASINLISYHILLASEYGCAFTLCS
jgi:hypothetical protein